MQVSHHIKLDSRMLVGGPRVVACGSRLLGGPALYGAEPVRLVVRVVDRTVTHRWLRIPSLGNRSWLPESRKKGSSASWGLETIPRTRQIISLF